MIEGTVDPDDCQADPVDEDRDAMMLMKEEWKDVYNQLKCGSEHYACWDCPSARARACAVEECEPHLIDRVRKRPKKEDTEE